MWGVQNNQHGIPNTNQFDQVFSVGSSTKEKAMNAMIGSLGFALFIIACCAAAGVLSGVVAGGCAIGLSVTAMILHFSLGTQDSMGNSRTTKLITAAIMTLVMTIIGALAISGILPANAVGYAYFGMVGVAIGLSFLACCCGAAAMCCALSNSQP